MPTAVGPNTKGEENLVFGYDLGDVSNSYKGEPTENLITNPVPTSTTGFSRSGGTGTVTYDTEKQAVYWEQTAYATWGSYFNFYPAFTGTLDTNSQYTFSVEYYNESEFAETGINYNLVQGNGQSGAVYYNNITPKVVEIGGGWKRFTYTFTPANSGVSAAYNRFIVGNKGTSVLRLWFRNIQFEKKSKRTPFVNGTRSVSGSLLDFTGNSTIDLTNASFDSSAQMTFDGTSDYASVGYSTAINTPNGATYEIMLYPESGGEFLSRGKSDSGTDPDNPRFYVDSTGYLYFDWSTTGADTYVTTPGSTVTFNQWHHIVGVAQPGDQLRIYVNGVEASYSQVVRTVPSTVPNSEDPIIIGGVSWIPRYFDGEVAMVKLYDRALTASEIKSNFNAIKGRFNI